MKAQEKHKTKSLYNPIVIVCCLIIVAIFFLESPKPNIIEAYKNYKVEENYGELIEKHASRLNLPVEYFKALALLESSGNNNTPHRFEPKVYKKLKRVQKGEQAHYENITRDMIDGASDKAIRDLATSWGPFQLMGYKCIQLGVYVHDLRGKDAVYWGIRWINHDYGKFLRSHKFQDSFHYHNTGRTFPQDGNAFTFDPNYVNNGIKYMQHF